MKKYTDTYRKNRVPEYGMDAASSDVSTEVHPTERAVCSIPGAKACRA